MRPIIRLMATALVVASAITLAGCGSDTSEKPSGTDARRNAAGDVLPVVLCVTGRTGSSMTVRFIDSADSQGNGPFPLLENSCGRSRPRGAVEIENIQADVLAADGTRPLEISATNTDRTKPYVYLTCRPGSSNRDRQRHEYNEGERHTFDCDQYVVSVERMTDSSTEKHFQVNIGLR